LDKLIYKKLQSNIDEKYPTNTMKETFSLDKKVKAFYLILAYWPSIFKLLYFYRASCKYLNIQIDLRQLKDNKTKQLSVVDSGKHGLYHISQINVVIPN
jgi:hypothetical protein